MTDKRGVVEQLKPGGPASRIATDDPPVTSKAADDEQPIVFVEYASGSLYLERPAEVARYRQMFDHLRAASLPVADSRRLLTAAADELV
jgi:hypothetical protein